MAFGISVNELDKPGRADTAMCVNVKSCRQLCQVSSLKSWSAPIMKTSGVSLPTSLRMVFKVSIVYVDFLRIDRNRQVKRFEGQPEHIDPLFRRCFQQGFLPGVPRRYQAQFIRLEQLAKIFPKLDVAYMNRIEAASQKNNASSSQIDSI